MEMNLSEISTDELIQAAHRMDIRIKALTEELDEMKTEIRRRVKSTGTSSHGQTVVKISENKRFSKAKAKKLLTKHEYSAICIPVPDSKRASVILGDERYAQICEEYNYRVSFSFAEEE